MSYEIIVSKQAEKQMDKLPLNIQKRLYEALENLRTSPYHYIKRLVGSSFFRMRVGNYRVIMDVINKKMLIHVVEVDHRKKVYKK